MPAFFRKAERAARHEDHVWANDAARTSGFVRDALRLAEEGRSVLAATRSTQVFHELATLMEAQRPAQCKDLFGQNELSTRLDQANAITIALTSALPHPAPAAPHPSRGSQPSPHVEILVFGRHERRTEDDAVLAFADSLGARARVTFHLSFEDPLLRRHAGAQIQELLGKLGMSNDEAIAHSMVTRAIEKAQRSL